MLQTKIAKEKKEKTFIWAPGVFHSKKQMIFLLFVLLFQLCLLCQSRVSLIKKQEKYKAGRQNKKLLARMTVDVGFDSFFFKSICSAKTREIFLYMDFYLEMLTS